MCNRILKAEMNDVFLKGAPIFRKLFDESQSVRCIALNKFSIGKLKKSFGKVEICRLKDFQTMPKFLNELIQEKMEEKMDVLEDLEFLPEFFDEQ